MRGGVSRFSVQKFLSHSAEKFHRGTLLCFRKFLVPKNVRDKREGGIHVFPSKLFCLTVPKVSVGECFTVAIISGSRKVYGQEGGVEYEGFPSKNLYLTVPKNFVGEPFCAVFQKISGSQNVYIYERGEYQDFPLKNFCLTVPKNFIEEPFCVSENFWYRKMLGIKERGGFTFFRRNCFVSQCRKIS